MGKSSMSQKMEMRDVGKSSMSLKMEMRVGGQDQPVSEDGDGLSRDLV